jgi:hypothetical protein
MSEQYDELGPKRITDTVKEIGKPLPTYEPGSQDANALARRALKSTEFASVSCSKMRLTDIFIHKAADGGAWAEWMEVEYDSAGERSSAFCLVDYYNTQTSTEDPTKHQWPLVSSEDIGYEKRGKAKQLLKSFEDSRRADPNCTVLEATGSEERRLHLFNVRLWKRVMGLVY